MRWPAVILLNTSLLFVTACDTNKTSIHHDLGNSVNRNKMVHIIKPRAPDPNAPLADMEGARAFRAIDRYHRGVTEEPKAESTTSTPGKSGGAK